MRPPIRAKPMPALTEAIELKSVAPSHSADQIRTSGPVGPLTMCLLSPTPGSEARSGETTRDRPPEPVEWGLRSADVGGRVGWRRLQRWPPAALWRPGCPAPSPAAASRCASRPHPPAAPRRPDLPGAPPDVGNRRESSDVGHRWSAVATTRLCGPASSRCSAKRQPRLVEPAAHLVDAVDVPVLQVHGELARHQRGVGGAGVGGVGPEVGQQQVGAGLGRGRGSGAGAAGSAPPTSSARGWPPARRRARPAASPPITSPATTSIRSPSPASATLVLATAATTGSSTTVAARPGWARTAAIDHDPVPPPTSSSRR